MSERQPITVKGFLIMADGSAKPIEELTKEERENWDRERTARLKRVMTDYYRQHPDEYALLEDAKPKDNYEKRV